MTLKYFLFYEHPDSGVFLYRFDTDRLKGAVIAHNGFLLVAFSNGLPAPAAGWFNYSEVQWQEGKGLFIKPRWTDKAREYINSGEYKYLSAVFSYDKSSGTPLQLKMTALVNYPGIDGMDEAVALAASHFNITTSETMSPHDLYRSLLVLLGIQLQGNEPTEAKHQQT